MDSIKSLLDFAVTYLPLILMLFGIGYLDGTRTSGALKRELLDSETKGKLLENEIKVDQSFTGKSDVDVVNAITGSKPDVK